MTYQADTADGAKAIRRELREAFPGVKFSVRTRRYSMGSAIDVRWTDGPTTKAVEAIANEQESIARDDYTGEILSGGNRYVSCDRELSPSARDRVAGYQARHYARAEWQSEYDWETARWRLSERTTFTPEGLMVVARES